MKYKHVSSNHFSFFMKYSHALIRALVFLHYVLMQSLTIDHGEVYYEHPTLFSNQIYMYERIYTILPCSIETKKYTVYSSLWPNRHTHTHTSIHRRDWRHRTLTIIQFLLLFSVEKVLSLNANGYCFVRLILFLNVCICMFVKQY